MVNLRVVVLAALSVIFVMSPLAAAGESQTGKDAAIKTSEVKILKERVDALEETMRNVVEAMETKEVKAAGKCRWVEECTYIYCCKWGSTGNGGTAKCLEQCCGATKLVYKCD